MPNPEQHTPYDQGREIYHGGGTTEQYRIKGNPNFRAKELNTFGEDLAELRTTVESGQKELKQYLGKFLPEYHLVYSGKNEQEPDAHIFMEEIAPVTPRGEKEYTDYLSQLDECYGEAWKMCKEAHLIPDLNSDNFVYGASKKTGVKKLYFVDTVPAGEPINPENMTPYEKESLTDISEIIEDDITELRERHKYDFPITMAALREMKEIIAQ